MTVARQILSKDLVRLWPWIALWNLAALGLGLQLALSGSGAPVDGWGHAFWTLASRLRWLVGPLLAALLFQTDGTQKRAAWLTRPMTGIQVLGAKVCFFAVFMMLIPTLAEVGALLALGLEPSRLTGVFFDAARFWVPLLALAGALAALSPGLASFAAALAAGTVICLSADRQALAILSSRYPGLEVSPLLDGWRTFAWIAVVLLALAVLSYQYARRRTVRSLLILVVTVPLVLATTLFWNRPTGPPLSHPQDLTGAAPAVQVLREKAPTQVGGYKLGSEGNVLLMARLTLSGPSKATFYELKVVKAKLDFAEGAALEVTHPGFSALGIERGFSSLFDGARWLGPRGYEWPRPLIWPVPVAEFLTHAYRPATLTGRLELDERSLSIVDRRPLGAAAIELKDGPEWLRFYRLPSETGTATYRLSGQRLETTATGRACRRWAVLHNPSTREIAPTRYWDEYATDGQARPAPLPWPAVQVLEKSLTLGDQWPLVDPEWIAQAELVVVRDCLTARYQIPFRLDDFIPAHYTPDAHRQRRMAAELEGRP
ncbi:MAG: hypothetical protein KDD11_00765 [Acidobacteria bacterium]|nr:hypothetical protein [Acidobacteriota bacterium]